MHSEKLEAGKQPNNWKLITYNDPQLWYTLSSSLSLHCLMKNTIQWVSSTELSLYPRFCLEIQPLLKFAVSYAYDRFHSSCRIVIFQSQFRELDNGFVDKLFILDRLTLMYSSLKKTKNSLHYDGKSFARRFKDQNVT